LHRVASAGYDEEVEISPIKASKLIKEVDVFLGHALL
jgi:hypothetical protein